MKKLLVLLLAFMLIAGVAWAGVANVTIINAVQLDDSPTSTSGVWNIQGYKEVGFFFDYNETEVANSVSATVTLDISYDGTNWLDVSFWDVAGTTTMQTSETLSADGWYYCALPINYYPAGSIVQVRVAIAGVNTDADDIIVVSTYLVGVK